MLVVIPFCVTDAALAAKNLEWCIGLDKRTSYDCLLSYEDGTNLDEVRTLAEQYFVKVYLFKRDRWDGERVWPILGNHAFQQTACHIADKFKGRSWFWWEPDMTFLRKGALKAIEDEHKRGGKPFSGAVVNLRGGYMAGCGVYPWNICDYSIKMLMCIKIPWDVAGGEEVLPHVHDISRLIHHEPIERGRLRPFLQPDRLQEIGCDAEVYHPCKDGTLIDCLKESGGISKAWTKFHSLRKKAIKASKIPLRLRRYGAIGDVIMVSAAAQKLFEYGFAPTIACEPVCAEALQNHPDIHTVNCKSSPLYPSDVILDTAYEQLSISELKAKTLPRIFAEETFRQLKQNYQREISDFSNLTPILYLTNYEGNWALDKLMGYPTPWIAVCPKSNSWPNRTVPSANWSAAARKGAGFGTWFWTGTDPAPTGFVDLNLRKVRDLMGILGKVHLVVSVDTGPAHLAAGLGTPLLMIQQCISSTHTLSDQRDWNDISTGLDCINCRERKCPINSVDPPCCYVSPTEIVLAVEKRLASINGNQVSAVIPFYKKVDDDPAKMNRLNRCLKAALPQVSEIIISFDGPGTVNGMIQDKRIRVVRHWSGKHQGFGKTCNHGIRMSNARYLMLLNDDLYLAPNAVENMMKVMDAKTAVVGCLLRYPDGRIQHGGTRRNPGDVGWGHIDYQRQHPSIKEPVEMENVTYAVAIIRREAYYQVRGFDERYVIYCEDNDLNLSLRQAGWKVMYTPYAEGIHDESQTTQKMGKNELSMQSSKQFRDKWEWYFNKNANNQLGRF